MTESLELPEITDAQRLNLWPGDTLVLRVPMPLRADQVDHLRAALRKQIPKSVKILILDSGMSLQILDGP